MILVHQLFIFVVKVYRPEVLSVTPRQLFKKSFSLTLINFQKRVVLFHFVVIENCFAINLRSLFTNYLRFTLPLINNLNLILWLIVLFFIFYLNFQKFKFISHFVRIGWWINRIIPSDILFSRVARNLFFVLLKRGVFKRIFRIVAFHTRAQFLGFRDDR